MTIRSLQVPPIGTNCYLIKNDETAEGAIIDPGGDAPGILATAKLMGMTPVAILLTHGHYDHTGAVAELLQTLPGIPVYLHPADAAQTKQPFSMMPDIGPTIPYPDGEFTVAGMNVKEYNTPGHTTGSVTLEIGETLFTGDTLFQGSCGRTDLPGGSSDQMMESLKFLAQMPENLQVLPGHEAASTLDLERTNNPYMRYAVQK